MIIKSLLPIYKITKSVVQDPGRLEFGFCFMYELQSYWVLTRLVFINLNKYFCSYVRCPVKQQKTNEILQRAMPGSPYGPSDPLSPGGPSEP